MHAQKATAFARRSAAQQKPFFRTIPTSALLLLTLASAAPANEAMFRALYDDFTCSPRPPASAQQSATYAELLKKHRHLLSFGTGGHGPLRSLLRRRVELAGSALVLEIGVFLGASLAEWLSVGDTVFAVGIDPFNFNMSYMFRGRHGHLLKDKTLYPLLSRVFNEPPGPIGLAHYMASTAGENAANRYCLIRGYAPEDLEHLMASSRNKLHASIQADLIYIDAAQLGNSHNKPDVIQGDDEFIHYWMGLYRDQYPQAAFSGGYWGHALMPHLPKALTAVALKWKYHLGVASNRTWFMAPPSTLGLWGLRDGCNSSSAAAKPSTSKSSEHVCNSIEWVVPP